MRSMMVSGIALAAALAAPALAQSKSPFVGVWTATATTPAGPQSETVTVAQTAEGYAITAKLDQNPQGSPEAGPATDIVVDGDSFSYKRSVSVPGAAAPIEIVYSGVVSGDTFTGKAAMFGMEIPYNGVRKP